MSDTATDHDADLSDLDALDGQHHAWCQNCYPKWAASPTQSMPLGIPFTAWCGHRAIYLVVWLDDSLPPGPLCPICWADPVTPCATCGQRS